MAPNSMETYRKITEDISSINGKLGRIEGLMEGTAEQRKAAHDEHVSCRHEVDKALDLLEGKYDNLDSKMQTLMIWGRSIAAVAGFAVVVLGVIVTLQAFGVHL